MKPIEAVSLFCILLLPVLILSSGCGRQSPDSTEIFQKETDQDNFEEIEWGQEVNLDEMTSMAREGIIVEIQWHMMPNILRAQASDGGIYHLRNENKGVDLRNALMEAGVRLGKDGVLFRHVF